MIITLITTASNTTTLTTAADGDLGEGVPLSSDGTEPATHRAWSTEITPAIEAAIETVDVEVYEHPDDAHTISDAANLAGLEVVRTETP